MPVTYSYGTCTGGEEMLHVLHSRDTSACAVTYVDELGWLVAIGHRYRRGPGCTCRDIQPAALCPAPGAHPLDDTVAPLHRSELENAFEMAPGAGVIAPCTDFDALVMPHAIGMGVMASLDAAELYTPCLTALHQTATLLVAPATGSIVANCPSVQVRSGSRAWVALPPSHGVRWDTAPTNDMPLPNADAIRPHLAQVLRLTAKETNQ